MFDVQMFEIAGSVFMGLPAGSVWGSTAPGPVVPPPPSPGRPACWCSSEVEGGGAVRHYAEPIDVRQRDATPEQFLWRGRLYLVRTVLAHWCEAGEWWRRPEAGLDDGEREFWRVEAAAGRGGAAGVYDLCFDWLRGGWTVARALD